MNCNMRRYILFGILCFIVPGMLVAQPTESTKSLIIDEQTSEPLPVVSSEKSETLSDVHSTEAIGMLPGGSLKRSSKGANNLEILSNSSKYNDGILEGNIMPSTGYFIGNMDLKLVQDESLAAEFDERVLAHTSASVSMPPTFDKHSMPKAANASQSSVPAFPGAQGYGAKTPGGRGGRVIEVTSLEAEGPGTLRSALSAKGPRIVVFRVGGTIELKGDISITEPFVTVAGQTAPGDGICIRGGAIVVRSHDVVVRVII